MKVYKIAVTGLHASCEPTAAQHIIYSLRTSQEFGTSKIIALNYDINTGGNFKNPVQSGVDEIHVTPSPLDDEKRFYAHLLKLIKETHIDIIIPTMDFETALFHHIKTLLSEEGIQIHIALPREFYFHDKHKLFRFCETHKIPMPWTVELLSIYSIDYYAPYLIYPILLKNTKGQEIYCYTLEEVYVFYRRLLREFKSRIYLQNYIAGEFYSACLLFGKQSEIIGKVIVKRMIVGANGESWGALSVTAPPLQAILDYLLFKLNLNYMGPLEIKFKRIIGTDIFYLTDIETRFPSWIHLATKAGQNFVAAFLKLTLDHSVEKMMPYQPGLMLIKGAFDQVSSIHDLGHLIMKGEMPYDKKAA